MAGLTQTVRRFNRNPLCRPCLLVLRAPQYRAARHLGDLPGGGCRRSRALPQWQRRSTRRSSRSLHWLPRLRSSYYRHSTRKCSITSHRSSRQRVCVNTAPLGRCVAAEKVSAVCSDTKGTLEAPALPAFPFISLL